MNKVSFISIIIAVITVVVIGTTFFVIAAVYRTSTPLASDECDRYNFVIKNTTVPTQFTLTKNLLSQWHWRYTIDDETLKHYGFSSGTTDLMCKGSFVRKYDTLMTINKKAVAYTVGKIFTVTSENVVKDCNGEILFTVKTGNALQTVLNNNVKIFTFFQILDPTNNVIAYIDKTTFLNHDIEIKNLNGVTVAKMYLNKITLKKWKWDITVIDVSTPAADFRLLNLIAAKTSFSENTESVDMCNETMEGFAITSLVIFSVMAILALAMAVMTLATFFIKSRKEPRSIKTDPPIKNTSNDYNDYESSSEYSSTEYV
jgi:flagellar basal body-associated protein FliL